MLRWLIDNPVLANLLTLLVLVVGVASYLGLPREQDPEVNFNWVQISTVLPGASAEDVEREITAPLEDGIRRVSDIKFVSSTSRENVSSILVRFGDIDAATFDKRVSDLRREALSKYNTEMPRTAREPELFEVKSSNAFPAAMVVLAGQADDEVLRNAAHSLKKDLERLPGVDSVTAVGLPDPELRISFDPARLDGLGLSASQLADSVAAQFRDTAAGAAALGDQEWLVRLQGRRADPQYLAELPLLQTGGGVTPLASVAQVSRGFEKPADLVRVDGKPAVLFHLYKKPRYSSVGLVDGINAFIGERTPALAPLGLRLNLADDQTGRIRESLEMMESNAFYGLLLMLFTTWLFLGWRLSLLNALVIPFTLGGLFWYMSATGLSLNTSVLIGILIALGMVVDGSVVVLDAVYYRLSRGYRVVKAVTNGLREVTVPVLVSAFTAIVAFLPLLFMPGILGDFMMMLPIVISVALLVSLFDAFWLLPSHIVEFRVNFKQPSRIHDYRVKVMKWLTAGYYKWLLKVLKRPILSALVALGLMAGAGVLVASNAVKQDFFADDPIRLFFINVDMAPGTGLAETLATTQRVEAVARQYLKPGEARSVMSYAGLALSAKEPIRARNHGQVFISLNNVVEDGRNVGAIIESMRAAVQSVAGPAKIAFLTRSSGPPVSKPIEIKVRGERYDEIANAARDLKTYLGSIPAVKNLSDDDNAGTMELKLTVNTDAAQRAGLNPADISRIVRLNVDGEIVGQLHDAGQKIEVRVLADSGDQTNIDNLLKTTVALSGGGRIALGDVVHVEKRAGKDSIRHYNFQRTLTLEADLDKTSGLNTVKVNQMVQSHWREIATRHPGISLDFSGELDDIKESVDSLTKLMLIGVGIIYIILGAQFKSYTQPLIILISIPLAFTGVVFGLFFSKDPLSLYTMYGMVALTGVIISTAIVLIDAINARRRAGVETLQAILQAATRRLAPILLTALTTFVDLIPLAMGWGGKSLIWSPMATAIVWGLLVSTMLTLFIIPLLYWILALRSAQRDVARPASKKT